LHESKILIFIINTTGRMHQRRSNLDRGIGTSNLIVCKTVRKTEVKSTSILF